MSDLVEQPASERKRFDPVGSIPFILIHLGALWVVVTAFSWKGLGLALAMYAIRMFGVTGVYHRYFSHRTYKTSRWFQYVLAWLAMTSFQKGVLWWAAHHRTHHKLSDKEGDVHSMERDGFWWSHVGWILSPDTVTTDLKKIPDLAKFPELVWLNKWWWIPPVAYSVAFYAFGGFWALAWGVGVSTVLLWHGTFTINSFSHWMGKVRYRTGDRSKNSWILAIITLGEGWHNNHHFYQRATNQGWFWWEVDVTFYVLKVLSWLGLVWDLTAPPDHVKYAHLRAGASRSLVSPQTISSEAE